MTYMNRDIKKCEKCRNPIQDKGEQKSSPSSFYLIISLNAAICP